MAKRISDVIIHLDYEDEYKDGKVEVNIIASEPEELVRCKDCKFGIYEKGRGIYHIRCEILEFLFQDDDYCSYGERREE